MQILTQNVSKLPIFPSSINKPIKHTLNSYFTEISLRNKLFKMYVVDKKATI